MTTIHEEDDGHLAPIDFAELLQDVSFGGTSDALTATGEPLRPDQCPLHQGREDCMCNGFLEEWPVSESLTAAPLPGIEEPDYSRFENWIPRYVRPEKPCDYCRSRRFNCYVQRGEPFCTPCATLFRECSLTNSQTLEATNYLNKNNGTFLDTLHVVDEHLPKLNGTFTGVRPLNSKGSGSGSNTPTREDAPGTSKRNGVRFPRHAVKTLRDWLDAHADNPYPTEEEKLELEKQTELKPSQIANWLANARRRRKVAEKSRPRLCMSPSLRPSTAAIPIPGAADKPWDELNPIERWQHSPPENEPADLCDIASAIARNDVPADDVSTSPSTLSRSKKRKTSSHDSGWSHARAPSTASKDTGRTSTLSASSARFSNGSSHSTHGSFSSFSSNLTGKKDRRRRRRATPPAAGRKAVDDKRRIFQCTFCTDTFKSKYDWTRHEKSLHLSLEKWVCAPDGPIVSDPESGNKKCVYCDLHNPSSSHLETHNHRQCEEKGVDARMFYRKDHLRQHLRLMHGCELLPTMDEWNFTAININSRCGFCAQRFSVWQERVDHLTAHFKAGARMVDWKGCRGVDPAVAALVTNAMPPYLIGIESVSPNPFSATCRGSWRQMPAEVHSGQKSIADVDAMTAHDSNNSSSEPTCWEIMTVKLGKYAKELAAQGIQMTDDMLQQQARRIVYGSDDSWNQTAADNAEWLDLFKKAHGLDFIPSTIGAQGGSVPDDLETYGDLGLRIPFDVQLRAYNQAQAGEQYEDSATRPGPYKVAIEQREANMIQVYALLAREGVLKSESESCDHQECKGNKIDVSSIAGGQTTSPTQRGWCSKELSRQMQERAEHLHSTVTDEAARCNISNSLGSLSSPDAHEEQARAKGLRTLNGLHGTSSCDKTSLSSGQARKQALQQLNNQEVALCPWEDGRFDMNAARARKRGLEALAVHEKCNATCEWESQDNQINAARARIQGLEALSRAEAPIVDRSKPPAIKPYLQRHRYELPKEKANMFATTTGAWKDSGAMSQTIDTNLADIYEIGAMMDLLDESNGASLASKLPTTDLINDTAEDWHLPDSGTISPEEMDEIIDAATAEGWNRDLDMNWTGDQGLPSMSTTTALPNPTTTGEIDIDNMDFDSIFNMPLDESFEQ